MLRSPRRIAASTRATRLWILNRSRRSIPFPNQFTPSVDIVESSSTALDFAISRGPSHGPYLTDTDDLRSKLQRHRRPHRVAPRDGSRRRPIRQDSRNHSVFHDAGKPSSTVHGSSHCDWRVYDNRSTDASEWRETLRVRDGRAFAISVRRSPVFPDHEVGLPRRFHVVLLAKTQAAWRAARVAGDVG